MNSPRYVNKTVKRLQLEGVAPRHGFEPRTWQDFEVSQLIDSTKSLKSSKASKAGFRYKKCTKISEAVIPVLQLQDGSFVGTVGQSNGQQNMIAFDQSGSVRWSVPNYTPVIATADGSIIATPAGTIATSGPAVTFDQNGNATGQINLPTQSWTGSDYTAVGSLSSISVPPARLAPAGASYWSQLGANPSGNGTAFVQCPCLLQSLGAAPEIRRPRQSVLPADLRAADSAPAPPATYVILEGEPGLNHGPGRDYNVGDLFDLAAGTEQDHLNALGNLAYSPRLVASVQDIATQLISNGPITGGVVYFGHGRAERLFDGSYAGSQLSPGENPGADTNIAGYNVGLLSNAELGPKATVTLHACYAGYGNPGYPSIAQLIANRLQVVVWAPWAGTFFSVVPNPGPRVSGGNAPPITDHIKPIYLIQDFGKPFHMFVPQ